MAGLRKEKELETNISQGCLKNILMFGEEREESITLQIVYLKNLKSAVELELSDTINKTRPIKISLPDFKKICLYSVIRVKYNTEPVDRLTSDIVERYHLIVKSVKILSPIKIKRIFGSPEYFAKTNSTDAEETYQENVYHSVSKAQPLAPSASLIPSTSMDVENSFEMSIDDDQLLMSISDQDLNNTIDESKEAKYLKELLVYLNEDLNQLDKEKLALMKEIKPLENRLKFLQQKKFEIEKAMFPSKKELTELNIELKMIEGKIAKLEIRIKGKEQEDNERAVKEKRTEH